MVKGNDSASIRLFTLVTRRYPKTQYAASALFYKAFLEYRQYKPGHPEPLRAALSSLRRLQREYPKAPQISDAHALRNRVCGELGQLGDSACRRTIIINAQPARIVATLRADTDSTSSANKAGGHPVTGHATITFRSAPIPERDSTCHNEKQLDSYVAALNSLWKVDSTRGMQAVSQVLMQRNRCLTRLREQALLIVMQRKVPVMAMAPVIFQVAREDPDTNVKRLATMWLLSQEWDPPAAKFLNSIFGQSFRVKLEESPPAEKQDEQQK
jgi:hypothetical protein